MTHWAVDVFELNQEQAEALVAYAKKEFGLFGETVNPRRWYSMRLDSPTVEDLLERIPSESRTESPLVEDLVDWLATAERPPVD
jgi:hypothetical protein